MSVHLECICGNQFEADEAQIGQTVKCVKCGSMHRVHGPRLAEQAVFMPGPPPLLSYAAPQPIPRASGEVLADIGWRIAGVAALAIQGMRLIEMSILSRNLDSRGMSVGPMELPFSCFGTLIAIVVAVGLWSCEKWARWAMLVIALLQAVVFIYIGQTPKPPVGSFIWYAGAATTVIFWILLLERPTNRFKLTVGAALAAVTLAGMLAVTLVARF